jgi:hypothetical protein
MRSAALGALSLCLAIGCILDGRQARRGSEVENELGVYGEMVDPDGKPVAGAKVRIFPPAGGVGIARAASDSDSTLTDTLGRYAFQGLDSGAYALLGDFRAGTLVVLRTGILLGEVGTDVNLGVDTLRPPGRIRGRLLLGDKGKGAVLCYIPGSSYLAVSDDSGRCTISGVPQGRYDVAYSAPGFLIPPDTGVAVFSTRTTDLPDKRLEYDPALSPPAPTGLQGSYDTATEAVTLAWDAVPVSDLEGFVIYRDEEDFPEPPPLRNGFTTATTFTDTSIGTLEKGTKRMLTYRVKARDRGANVSGSFSAPCSIEAVSRSFVATEATLAAERAPEGRATPGDTVRFVLAYSNPRRAIHSVSWWEGASAVPVRSVTRAGRDGKDTLIYVPDSPGQKRIRALLKDETGTIWAFGADLEVVADPPKAVLRVPGQAFSGDTARVDWSGSSDSAGRVVRFELRVGGSGAFTTVSGKDSLIAIPVPARGDYPLDLRVTDDDGNVSMATARIRVIGKGIWTLITPSASPITGTTYAFKAAEMGGRAWIVSTTGVYSSADRVTWEPAGNLPVGPAEIFALAAYRGKLYCFPSAADGRVSVYASVDGSAWETIADPLPIRQDAEFPSTLDAVPFQGKLFVYATWAGSRVKTEIWSWEATAGWKQESVRPAFIGRLNIHPIEWSGRLWIYGGHTSALIDGAIEDDVWSSADGVVWSRTADSVGGYREWPEIMPCGDHLVVMGGEDEFGQTRSDLWTSSDGIDWIAAPPAPGFIGTAAAVAVGADGTGYLYGGKNKGSGWQKSVWSCE